MDKRDETQGGGGGGKQTEYLLRSCSCGGDGVGIGGSSSDGGSSSVLRQCRLQGGHGIQCVTAINLKKREISALPEFLSRRTCSLWY